MHVAQAWRVKGERYAFRGVADNYVLQEKSDEAARRGDVGRYVSHVGTGLTETEAKILFEMHVPISKFLELTREELRMRYPLAFEIAQISVDPIPHRIRRLRDSIRELPEDLRVTLWAVATAMIATF